MESQERTPYEDDSLWQALFSRDNLFKALERVRENGGAAGIDGMTVDELAGHLVRHWSGIRRKLDKGTYVPSPVRQVRIPKANGGERILGIPTVQDRLIQQAMNQVLSPMFEPTFSEASYGFRVKRNAHQAIRQAREYIAEGYEWVVDIDLERFFDTVNHDRLMARLKAQISDKRVLRLINAYLKAGVLNNGVVVTNEMGTPQGSPLSPLLSNIVLTELDRQLEARGHRFVRYADDCNIYVKSQKAAERVMESTTRFIETRMRLKVNQQKSAVGQATKRKFLGFSFYKRQGQVRIRIAPQSLCRLKQKLRQMTRRHSGQSLEAIRNRINSYLEGWMGYFHLADIRTHMERIDEWLRRRMRQICLTQWKTTQSRYQNLRRLGVPTDWAQRLAGSNRGAWRLAKSPWMHRALSKAYWRTFGLKSFADAYRRRHT